MSNAPVADSATTTRIEYERQGRVATVRFVSDKGPPLLSSPVLGELGEIARRLAEDPCVRFVVFRGSDGVFSAGADIERIAHITEDEAYSLSKAGQSVLNAIENLPQITFAAINGHAMAGGCELALACSFRIAVAAVKLGLPEVKLGLIPGWGATKRLPMMIPLNWALRMLYSGEPVDAELAERIGLVDEVVPAEGDLDAALERWFGKLRHGAPQAIIRVKRAILNDDEARQFGLCFSSPDAKEGMRAFLEKRPPAWTTDKECNGG